MYRYCSETETNIKDQVVDIMVSASTDLKNNTGSQAPLPFSRIPLHFLLDTSFVYFHSTACSRQNNIDHIADAKKPLKKETESDRYFTSV